MAGLVLLPPERFPCILGGSLGQYFSFPILSLCRLWYQNYSLQKCAGGGEGLVTQGNRREHGDELLYLGGNMTLLVKIPK